ncbi:MAG TPA: hypothetical protein VGF55_20330 [Gemmataceae bacterium]|jgi:hypothetical protein
MTDGEREILDQKAPVTDRVRDILESLNQDERQQLLHALLIEHFAVGEREVEVHGDDEAIVGYLISPGVRLAHLLGIDPREAPPQFAGPHYPAGHAVRMLERMAAEEEARTATNR